MSTPTGATFFAHVHDVYMDPAARSAATLLEVRDIEAVQEATGDGPRMRHVQEGGQGH
jgi:hypothetical protein